jgi:hypothetical protein
MPTFWDYTNHCFRPYNGGHANDMGGFGLTEKPCKSTYSQGYPGGSWFSSFGPPKGPGHITNIYGPWGDIIARK